jgi:hypothetical protein
MGQTQLVYSGVYRWKFKESNEVKKFFPLIGLFFYYEGSIGIRSG